MNLLMRYGNCKMAPPSWILILLHTISYACKNPLSSCCSRDQISAPLFEPVILMPTSRHLPDLFSIIRKPFNKVVNKIFLCNSNPVAHWLKLPRLLHYPSLFQSPSTHLSVCIQLYIFMRWATSWILRCSSLSRHKPHLPCALPSADVDRQQWFLSVWRSARFLHPLQCSSSTSVLDDVQISALGYCSFHLCLIPRDG